MSAAVHHIAHHVPRSPQLENGYLRLSNELNQAICRAHLSANEMAIVLAIIAKTYGFNKKTDDVSASQLGEYCDIARNHVTEVLKSLEAKNIITKRSGRYGSIVGIQKDYSQWQLKGKRQPRAMASPKPVSAIEVVRNSDLPSPKLGLEVVQSSDTQKTTSKDNQQKTKTSPASPSAMLARFDAFWAAWPKKDEKKDAKALFLKIAPDDAKLQLMLDAVARTKASGKWDKKRFIVSPVKWLRGERWSDEVVAGYTDQQSNVIAKFNEILGDLAGDADDDNFRESRASAIDAFLTFDKHPERGDYAARYFGHIRKTAVLPWKAWVSFDWLISRDGHGKVLERVLEKQ